MNKFEVVMDKHRKNKGEIILPRRGTAFSAGYDFYASSDFVIPAMGESELIFFDVKAKLDKDKFLLIVPRSSLGVKHGITLANTMGIIDADYYSNPSNDGNICAKFVNRYNKDFHVEKGDRILQGIILSYFLAEGDEPIEYNRQGGYGSTKK